MKKQIDRDEVYEILIGGSFGEYMKSPMSMQERAKAIGSMLKSLRERSEVSQRQICKALDLTPQTYSGYESGKHVPPIETLVRMAYLFNVPLDFLVCKKNIVDPDDVDELGIHANERDDFLDYFVENRKMEAMVTRMMQLDGRMAEIEAFAKEFREQNNEQGADK